MLKSILAKIIIPSIFFVFISCSNKQSNESVVAELKAGLEESNKNVAVSNDTILEALKIRQDDPKTNEKAQVWLPKANKIVELSKTHLEDIEKLKSMLADSSHDKESVNKLLSREMSPKKLHENLSAYWKSVLAVDPKIQQILIGERDPSNEFFLKTKTAEDFEEQYFASVNKKEADALFSKFQNDILRIENKCLLFCLEQTTVRRFCDFEINEAIVGQNAKILKAGDELEITAGMGSFKNTKVPKITIGDRVVGLNDKNMAIHKFQTSKKPGKYSLPVKVEFTDQDGKPQERTFNVEYTLVEAIKKQ